MFKQLRGLQRSAEAAGRQWRAPDQQNHYEAGWHSGGTFQRFRQRGRTGVSVRTLTEIDWVF